jgi:arabinofuranan 3-O-arabinosyltransferase
LPRQALVTVVVVTASLTGLRELVRAFRQPPGDFLFYVHAGRAFARGEVDGTLPAVLTPAVILLARTVALLPPAPAALTWRLLSVAAWAATLGLLWRAYRHRLTSVEVALAFALACQFESVLMNLRLGQVNLLVLLLAVLALGALDRGRPGTAGVALGLSLALKPLAALLVPGLLVMGHRRVALTAALAGAAAFGAAAVVVHHPVGSDLWFREGLPLVLGGYTREGYPAYVELNQSLPGVLAKLGDQDAAGTLHAAGWVGGAVLALAALFLVGTEARAGRHGLWLPATFLLTVALVTAPLAWPYYTVMLAPSLVATWPEVRRRRSWLPAAAFAVALYLVALIGTLPSWVPRDGSLPRLVEALGRSPQFVGSAILLILQAWLLWPGPEPSVPVERVDGRQLLPASWRTPWRSDR